jgi:hypothetical protein
MSIFDVMTVRRWIGTITLLAMAQFIVVGNAAACPPPHGDAAASAITHTECTPASSQSNRGSRDLASQTPCCVALTSCATVPLATQGEALAQPALIATVAARFAERAPRTEIPAPELPPPKA